MERGKSAESPEHGDLGKERQDQLPLFSDRRINKLHRIKSRGPRQKVNPENPVNPV
jgi:hypothetical protein